MDYTVIVQGEVLAISVKTKKVNIFIIVSGEKFLQWCFITNEYLFLSITA